MPFSVNDREILCAVKGVGPTVIARLEQMGYSDLEQLAAADAQGIVERAAALVGSSCWKNSPQAKAAVQAAIAAATRASKTMVEPGLVHEPLLPDHAIRELESMANLGPKSAAILAAAGIDSLDHLAMLGSVAAFAMAKRSGARVSLNLLWAIEGALTGESWQTVSREHRASLLLALDSYETGGQRQ
ncbi:TfoX/Sxy family DNA transformation protein [Massilia sp. CCM 9210]|uniref:TfoX/Sxy family protein n=1 Tax=Massilia scottii TaxID=3057166 RepID=UPI0027964C0A|nr:TfoX/Sxy family protein [Massilia sp. CCM 9210]MDQ1813741.1 TfoX/Sxy family DNA transformation protein [Massilia sp. CCM 9210]